MNWLQKLQKRWNVNSPVQAFVILLVFALTGFSVMFLKRWVKPWFADDAWFDVWYYIAILPLYNLLLLAYGFAFGQGQYFWEFEKRFFGRIFKKKNKQP